MRINHNIPALRALNQLDKSHSKLDKTLERLSSGLRINHAADDAAGLAITQKMDAQIRGLKQANRNAMDGISLIQTAEGALSEVHDMLQRIRELSVQVSNGTYGDSDREAVQDEVDQLQKEIDRVSTSIEFNEKKLLNGDLDRRVFSSDDAIASVDSISDTVPVSTYQFDVTTAATQSVATGVAIDNVAPEFFDGANQATVGGVININGEQVTVNVGDTNNQVYTKVRDLCNSVGISLSSTAVPPVNGSIFTLTMDKYGNKPITITGDNALIDGLGIGANIAGNVNGLDTVVDLATITVANGFPAGTIVTTDGQDITFTGTDDFEMKLTGGGGTGTVVINLLNTGPLDLQIGANQGQFMEVRIPDLSSKSIGIADIDLGTVSGAQEAIQTANDAIEMISTIRSKLGAYQNRLEHTIANLDSASENMTASLSRILDADMAYEMAQFTQQNIIQQAGTSMLAQANQRPQSLLQLLQ